MKSISKPALSLLGVGITSALAGTQAAFGSNGISAYLSAPRSQASIYTSTTTETFTGFATGIHTTPLVSAIGTYQLTAASKLAIVADDQYSAGTGNYAALGAESGSAVPVVLQLTASQAYFGISWNAGDANNEITFYQGSKLVGYYSTAKTTGLLSHPTVTTLDGRTYQSSAYNGQPTTLANAGEPYAFINFIDTGGTFDKIVFGNSNNTGTGFESDNHTIRVAAPVPDGSFVYAGIASVPEPGNVGLMIGFGAGSSVLIFKRRKKRAISVPTIGENSPAHR